MIIIGEKINTTRKPARDAVETRDAQAISALAQAQAQAGARYIDINAGTFVEDEPQRLAWLARAAQQDAPLPLCVDSPNPLALQAALDANAAPDVLINSITAERERWQAVLPLVCRYKAKVIALTMDDAGMPETVAQRVTIAHGLVARLTDAGVEPGDIFIDPLVRPIATGTHYAQAAVQAMGEIKALYPAVHIACGLSNVSFGLPARKLLNQAFLVAAMQAGMDGAILDPLDVRLMATLCAAQALLDQDEYCMAYIAAYRQGKLQV
ncbi:MAG: dihydropteroate synthase [Oscillospiraceae bacterium]|jgi:5-methyltetrahydrofolate--homocysteine methyltransferase|nr:dihydropteroate synthase [Oscillospiraceae bacterium]